MSGWNTNESWSGGGGAVLAAEPSSWNAGAEPTSDWDSGAKSFNAQSFDTHGFANGDTLTNGGQDDFTNNAGGGGDDRTCRICNETGHFARDCPQKPEGSGKCFNCGEEG
ncbi:MAG: hypothetical protein Q9166_003698 [cf. Caloplaca sp. 2 TL-2023]